VEFAEVYRRRVLGLLVLAVTIAFLAMIQKFLVTMLLAAIFSALLYPLYRRLLRAFRGRKSLASAVTLLLALLLVVIPLAGFIGVLVGQAISVTNSVAPWLQSHLSSEDQLVALIQRVPYGDRLLPYRGEVLSRTAEAVHAVGAFVVSRLSDVTRGTLSFLFNVVLMLYAMFFYLCDGPRVLQSITRHLPLSTADTDRLVGKFVSVARATLTSTMAIGVIQGTLGGLGFAVAGIPGAVFWGTMMTVLSMIPGIGTALVWVPGCIYLFAIGKAGTAIVLALYCLLIVGSVDNLLRPRLVGKGAQMDDLLVLLSTLGGIAMFGAVGFILGPIIAALFITLWDILGASVGSAPAERRD
jgi:predicted PurR-regulated permease PerM